MHRCPQGYPAMLAVEAFRSLDASNIEVNPVIEVVSDVVCPWCFIGKRRMERALALLGREDVQLRWTAFQLNPGAPSEGMNRAWYRARKFGSAAHAKQLEDHVAAAGAADGIHFRFDRIQTIPNTFDAHRLIWLAGREGVQDALVENLFRAYFVDGEDAGNAAILKRIALDSGLEAQAVEGLLTSDAGAAEVRAEERNARLQGVTGVPTFFINGEAFVSGAQKSELIAAILEPALGANPQQCFTATGQCG